MNIQAPTFEALSVAQKRALILRDQLRYTDPHHLDTFIEGVTDDEPPTYTLVNGKVQPELISVKLKEEAERFDLGNVVFPENKNAVCRVFLTVEKGCFEWRPTEALVIDEADLKTIPIHSFIARGMIPLFQSKHQAIVDRRNKINAARKIASNMLHQPKARYYDGESITKLGKRRAGDERSSGGNKSKKPKPGTLVPKHISNLHDCVHLETIPNPKKIETLNAIPEQTKIALFDTIVKTAFPNFDSLMTVSWNVVSIHKESGCENSDLLQAINDLDRVLHAFEDAFKQREGGSKNVQVDPKTNDGGPTNSPGPATALTQKRPPPKEARDIRKTPKQAPPQEQHRRAVPKEKNGCPSIPPGFAPSTQKREIASVVVQKPSTAVAAPRKDSAVTEADKDGDDGMMIVEPCPTITTTVRRGEEANKDTGKVRSEPDSPGAVSWVETSPEPTPRPMRKKPVNRNASKDTTTSEKRLKASEMQVQHEQTATETTYSRTSCVQKPGTAPRPAATSKTEHHERDRLIAQERIDRRHKKDISEVDKQRLELENQRTQQRQPTATPSTAPPRRQKDSITSVESKAAPTSTIDWGNSSRQPRTVKRPSVSPITPPSGVAQKMQTPLLPPSTESPAPTSAVHPSVESPTPLPTLMAMVTGVASGSDSTPHSVPNANADVNTASPNTSPGLPGTSKPTTEMQTDVPHKTPSPGIAPVAQMEHNREQWKEAEVVVCLSD